jgi:hypothetical protein
MKWTLTKLSEPGWERTYPSYKLALAELVMWNCEQCLLECRNGDSIESTHCSLEFMIINEEEDA